MRPMRLTRLLLWLVLPAATVTLIAFAIANRAPVLVSLDPLPFEHRWPLFAVVFASIALGIVVGGVATWLGQRKWRRLARERRRANDALRRELAAGRASLPAAKSG